MQSKRKNKKKDYISNLYIRYIRCLDCEYTKRIFDPKNYSIQKCFNEQCDSKNTKFRDIKPHFYKDEIRCHGKFACSNCSHHWTSYATWIFYKQSCFKCSKRNHPYECKDHEFFGNKFGYGDSTSENKHEEANCEFCEQLGRLCTKHRGNDHKYFP